MKHTLLLALAMLAGGCVSYHERYLMRLYREQDPALLWWALYGVPMEMKPRPSSLPDWVPPLPDDWEPGDVQAIFKDDDDG